MLINELEYACTYTLDDPLILSSSTLEDHLDELDTNMQRLQDKAPESTLSVAKVDSGASSCRR